MDLGTKFTGQLYNPKLYFASAITQLRSWMERFSFRFIHLSVWERLQRKHLEIGRPLKINISVIGRAFFFLDGIPHWPIKTLETAEGTLACVTAAQSWAQSAQVFKSTLVWTNGDWWKNKFPPREAFRASASFNEEASPDPGDRLHSC